MSTPAGDGVTNLVKFVLGVPPMASAAAALPVPSQGAQEIALAFTLNPEAQGLVLSLEVSDDLKTWTAVPNSIEPLRTNPTAPNSSACADSPPRRHRTGSTA